VVQAPTFFKLPQRLDSVVRNDEQIGVSVYVLQDLSENLVKGAVLVRECSDRPWLAFIRHYACV